MMKKYTAILFLFVAYAIFLGHNIIPHHHHDNEHDLTEHHEANHHDDEASNDLSHLFSHFVHPADGFTLTTNHNTSNTFSKQIISLVSDLPDNFSLDDFDIPPLSDKPPAEHFIYISPHSHPSGLRAPPAILI